MKEDDKDIGKSLEGVNDIFSGLMESQVGLQKAIGAIAKMQVNHMKAAFESMSLEQRDVYCKTMVEGGATSKQLKAITGKSYSTINRHLNGKNS